MLHKKHVSTSRSQGLYRSRAKMSEPLLTRISTTLACSGPRTVIQAGSSGTSDLDASISGCHKLQDCNQTLKSPSMICPTRVESCIWFHVYVWIAAYIFPGQISGLPRLPHITSFQRSCCRSNMQRCDLRPPKEKTQKHAKPTLPIFFIFRCGTLSFPLLLSCSLSPSLSLALSLSHSLLLSAIIHNNLTGPPQPFKLVLPLA